MGLVTESFNGNGTLKTFTVSNDILSKSHCRVHFYYDLEDHEIFEDDWDLLGQSTIVFDDAPTNGYVVKITTSSDGTGLGSSPSEISEVAANIDDIIIVAKRAIFGEIGRSGPHRLVVENQKLIVHQLAAAVVPHLHPGIFQLCK